MRDDERVPEALREVAHTVRLPSPNRLVAGAVERGRREARQRRARMASVATAAVVVLIAGAATTLTLPSSAPVSPAASGEAGGTASPVSMLPLTDKSALATLLALLGAEEAAGSTPSGTPSPSRTPSTGVAPPPGESSAPPGGSSAAPGGSPAAPGGSSATSPDASPPDPLLPVRVALLRASDTEAWELLLEVSEAGDDQPTCPSRPTSTGNCTSSTLADGSLLVLDQDSTSTMASATLLRPDGLLIRLTQSRPDANNGWNRHRLTPNPGNAEPLTVDQLRRIVTDPRWGRTVPAVPDLQAPSGTTEAGDPWAAARSKDVPATKPTASAG
ncbi:hypothetical protein [Allostreptomyces psammosilenae]|uniref:Uncharacterized protein n=1 Tax=Allostreptomyces psammosilenae TaxID=1892865 RepID=A0A852ZWG3_9ACTN|nr:hypothetical protein [Allostreptomyces psammosilenae]NYI05590.1 hypothetical protein [Allostreptomyces psammosilenae]